jgi:hypothetical protein
MHVSWVGGVYCFPEVMQRPDSVSDIIDDNRKHPNIILPEMDLFCFPSTCASGTDCPVKCLLHAWEHEGRGSVHHGSHHWHLPSLGGADVACYIPDFSPSSGLGRLLCQYRSPKRPCLLPNSSALLSASESSRNL